MSREIWHDTEPDADGRTAHAMDYTAAEATALGMTELEADAWSTLDNFVNAVTVATWTEWGGQIPDPIAASVATIRMWLLARPQERRLANLIGVEPIRTAVR